MSLRRFKVEHLQGDVVAVTGGQAHHALHVLRLKRGDTVVLFDGRGHEAEGEVHVVARNVFTVRVLKRRTVEAAGGELSLAVAAPKGERADWMVEKCAELGVSLLVPLLCTRTQVVPGDGRINRWRRKATEAAKQSQQSAVLNIETPMPISQAVMSCAPGAMILYGEPHVENKALLAALAELSESQGLMIFIGPEGGFTDQEIAALREAAGRPVRLAASILRVETAAVTAAAVWAQWKIGRFDGARGPS